MGIVDRTPPSVRGNLGEYNKIIKVNSSTTFEGLVQMKDHAFIVENYQCCRSRFRWWNHIPVSSVTKEVIPIGVKKVVIGIQN